jgi:hypothetical protein
MPEQISIKKANPLLPAEDYEALRKNGMKLIEKLGSDIWTDYNNSDPGITILEAVCYAITDLAYRNEFEVKDLLAPEHLTEETWKQIFYTARQILHNSPLTISDYRKLMIDVKGVRNAWIEPSKDYEVPVWVDYSLVDGNCKGKLGLKNHSKIVEFEGLYNVMIEYQEDVLTENHREEVRGHVIDRLSRHRNLCEDFLSITAVDYADFGIGASISLEEDADPDDVLSQVFFAIYNYFTPSVPFHTIQEMQEKGYTVDDIFEGPALYHGFIDTVELEKTDLFRDIRLSDIISEIADIKGIKAITYLHILFNDKKDKVANNYFIIEDDSKNIPIRTWIEYLKEERKIARIKPELSQVIFCKERDLITYYIGRPEDRMSRRMLKLFSDLKALERKYKLSGHETDFPVPAGENMKLEDYYPVTYSLPMCYGVNNIAGLPANADEKRTVQSLQLKGYLLFFEQLLSDHLVQLNHLCDLFTFDNTVKQTYFTRALKTETTQMLETTEIEDLHVFLIDHGSYDKNGLEKISAKIIILNNLLIDRGSYDKNGFEKIAAKIIILNNLLVNSDNHCEESVSKILTEITGLQNLFVDYNNHNEESVKKILTEITDLQNLFVDYNNHSEEDFNKILTEITSFQNILAENNNQNEKCFNKVIVEITDLENLPLYHEKHRKEHHQHILKKIKNLKKFFANGEKQSKEYFDQILSKIIILSTLLDDQIEKHFNKIITDFTHILYNLIENQKTFHKRRNGFLDHMLARFSEDLSEYEALSRWLTPDKVDENLIQDKTQMLKDGEYYSISTNRGKGYDYDEHEIRNTSNVSGTERRVSRLLGFKDATRRTLSPSCIIVEPVMETDPKTGNVVQKKNTNGEPLNIIRLIDHEKNILLTSIEVKENCCTDLLMNQILIHADDRRYFKFYDEPKQRSRKSAELQGTFRFELWDGTDLETATLLGFSELFDTENNCEKAFRALQKLMEEINRNEGLHLVEHILLRPKLDEVLDETGQETEVTLLDICLDECDLHKGEVEGEQPLYRKKIHRTPAEKCYDKMPWVLEYVRLADMKSFLFQEVFVDDQASIMLKFKRYEALAKRIRDLQEFGSEHDSYEIIAKQNVVGVTRYSFIIHGGKGNVIAQSIFYNTRIDAETEINHLIHYFGYELDWYCAENPCDNNEDPYSFRTTVVLPCWPKRFRDRTFRNLVEKTLQIESPAHVHTRVVWVGVREMQRFEKAYYDWLQEMSKTEIPAYEKVNPLVQVMNTLKPCGHCEDECK